MRRLFHIIFLVAVAMCVALACSEFVPLGTERSEVAATTPDAAAPTSVVDASDAAVDLIDGGACSKQWCWENPRPQGALLNDVWGATANDVWAVGYGGTILHSDGTTWSQMQSGVATALNGVWGSAANDVWAVGDKGIVLHWDGTAWTAHASGTTSSLYAVWGTNTSDIWAVGQRATIIHYDGTTWTVMPSGTVAVNLLSIWGSGASDVWAVGESDSSSSPGTGARARILHFDGTAWSVTLSSNQSNGDFGTLKTVWGSGPTAVFAAGEGQLLRFDGTAWTEAGGLPAGGGTYFIDMWGSGPNDVWVLEYYSRLLHWDGTAWTRPGITLPTSFHSLWGTSANDMVFVGYGGSIIRGSVETNTWTSQGATLSTSQLNAVWANSETDIWAVGDKGEILHSDGVAWTTAPSGTTQNLSALWASSPSDMWAVGAAGILHYDGTTWTRTNTTPCSDVWGSGASDVWVSARQSFLHFDGTAWRSVPAPNLTTSDNKGVWGLTGIAGSGPSDVWAVGSEQSPISPGSTFYTHILMAAHWDGTAWSSVPVPRRTGSDPDVWVAGPNDVYIHSAGLHYDGSTWTNASWRASRVWGTSSANLWGVGADITNEVAHWNGAAWDSAWGVAFDYPYGRTPVGLRGVHGDSTGNVWAVGSNAAILRRKP